MDRPERPKEDHRARARETIKVREGSRFSLDGTRWIGRWERDHSSECNLMLENHRLSVCTDWEDMTE